jgi:peptide deformylase
LQDACREPQQEGDLAMSHYLNPVTISPELLAVPHSVLRQHCARLDFAAWSPEHLRELVEEMLWLQHHLGGAGLAAPQVGVTVQLAVVDNQRDPPTVLINPEIVFQSKETEFAVEGCLSIPGYTGLVERPMRVAVKATNAHGELFELLAHGALARTIQHEIDHLHGILYPDRMQDINRLHVTDADSLARRALDRLYPVAAGSGQATVRSRSDESSIEV